MGGLTGIRAAHRAYPQSVTKLVLVDVVPRFESAGSHRIRDFMTRHACFETLEHAADAIADYLPHRRRPENRRTEEESAPPGRAVALALGSGVRHLGGR